MFKIALKKYLSSVEQKRSDKSCIWILKNRKSLLVR